eukprot:1408135-Rhodomonas_salina.1
MPPVTSARCPICCSCSLCTLLLHAARAQALYAALNKLCMLLLHAAAKCCYRMLLLLPCSDTVCRYLHPQARLRAPLVLRLPLRLVPP